MEKDQDEFKLHVATIDERKETENVIIMFFQDIQILFEIGTKFQLILHAQNLAYGLLWPRHDSNTQSSDLDALPVRHGISNIEILFQFNCQTRNFIRIVLLKTDWALCPCGKRKKIKKDYIVFMSIIW